ncbi:MAG: hypothetical protein DRJ52_06375 [Thermoprotei archaeon]|nr:MAG: hypothetical protein DRJ52_06375 [Thermoprotei archaeon]
MLKRIIWGTVLFFISFFALMFDDLMATVLLVLSYIIVFKIALTLVMEKTWGVYVPELGKIGATKYIRKGEKYEVGVVLRVKSVEHSVSEYDKEEAQYFVFDTKEIVESLLNHSPTIVIKKKVVSRGDRREHVLEYLIKISKRGKNLKGIIADLKKGLRVLAKSLSGRDVYVSVENPKVLLKVLNLKRTRRDWRVIYGLMALAIVFFLYLSMRAILLYFKVFFVFPALLFTLSLLLKYRGFEISGKWWQAYLIDAGDLSDHDFLYFARKMADILSEVDEATIIVKVWGLDQRAAELLERAATRKYVVAGITDFLGMFIKSSRMLERAERRRKRREYVYRTSLFTDSSAVVNVLEGYGYKFEKLIVKTPLIRALFE